MMKERLRLQRQRSQQQSERGNCESNKCMTSDTSESSCPTVSNSTVAASPTTVQSPIKGRRFQRSRHAEQQARTRSQSQDAAVTSLSKDGLFGCAGCGGTRPLQKSKSVDADLETIAKDVGTDRRPRTASAEVRKRAAFGSSQKVEKKGSFLARSSSLLARLSGRGGQKKLQSPSPLRHNETNSENPDDSLGASADRSGTSSTLSKTVSSLSDTAGHFEVLMSSDSACNGVEGAIIDSRREQTVPTIVCQPAAVVHSQSDQVCERMKTDLLKSNDRQRVCRCNSRIPASRADSKGREKVTAAAAATEQGSEIVFAAELRRWLPLQATEDWVTAHTNAEDCGNHRPQIGRRPVSVSAGNLLKRLQERDDFTSNDIQHARLNAAAVTSPAVLPVAAGTSSAPAAAVLDAVAMTSAQQQRGEYIV